MFTCVSSLSQWCFGIQGAVGEKKNWIPRFWVSLGSFSQWTQGHINSGHLF